MKTRPTHPSQRSDAKPVNERTRMVVKSMAEMSKLMQSKVAAPKKSNSQG